MAAPHGVNNFRPFAFSCLVGPKPLAGKYLSRTGFEKAFVCECSLRCLKRSVGHESPRGADVFSEIVLPQVIPQVVGAGGILRYSWSGKSSERRR